MCQVEKGLTMNHELVGCRVKVNGNGWEPNNHPATWRMIGKIGTVLAYFKFPEFFLVEFMNMAGESCPALLYENEFDIVGPDDCEDEEPDAILPEWKWHNDHPPFDLIIMRSMVFGIKP